MSSSSTSFDSESRGGDIKMQQIEAGDPVVTDVDDDGRHPRRNGNYRTATAHIITAVIGSGVLALGYAVGTIG